MSTRNPNVTHAALDVRLCRFLSALETARQHGDALLDLLDADAADSGHKGTVGRLAGDVRGGLSSIDVLYAHVRRVYGPRPRPRPRPRPAPEP
jgi:hypothetical protein